MVGRSQRADGLDKYAMKESVFERPSALSGYRPHYLQIIRCSDSCHLSASTTTIVLQLLYVRTARAISQWLCRFWTMWHLGRTLTITTMRTSSTALPTRASNSCSDLSGRERTGGCWPKVDWRHWRNDGKQGQLYSSPCRRLMHW